MKRLFLILLMASSLVYVLSGCSASKRASRLIKKARRIDPTLFVANEIRTVDTLVIEVPKVSEKVLFDTLVQIKNTDPITLKEEIIKYQIKNDTIMIDCPDQEVITETITKTEMVYVKPTFWEQIKNSLYLVGALAVLIFIVRRFL